jgi:hypothetical protein
MQPVLFTRFNTFGQVRKVPPASGVQSNGAPQAERIRLLTHEADDIAGMLFER